MSNAGRALITGASAGIGAAYARRLAADGNDLVLVARRRDRLEALAAELRASSGVRVDVLQADLSEDEGMHAVERALSRDDALTGLVNNAGFGAYRPFAQLEPDIAEDLVRVHVLATVRLTRAALAGMVARGRGSIVNVASLLAFSGKSGLERLPPRATYAGAKAFMVTFTQALADELAGSGVRVQVCCPGLVKTEFHEVQGIDMSFLPRMTAEDVVTASLAGLEAGEVVCAPAIEDASLVAGIDAAHAALMAAAPNTTVASRYLA